ncbi:MAG: ATP-binding protein [Lachnospiraceae bacterium]|nr:ATP-binding protein [Lachnospiraceae bacterium]
MIWDIWIKISYMVQVLAACLIYMIPAKKRKFFPLRISISSILFVVIAYILSTLYFDIDHNGLYLEYWAIYIFTAIIFVWIGIEASFLQALYCGICSCGMQHIAFDIYMIYQLLTGGKYPIPDVNGSIVSVFIYIFIYILFYYLFARKLTVYGKFIVNKDAVFPIATMILLVWVISILELSSLNGFEAGIYNHVIYRIIDALCCFYVLWVQTNQKEKLNLQRELDGINAAARQQEKQYIMTSETIESINRKCHDLKHQIRSLREMTEDIEKKEYLSEIENDIMIYDVALMTGNRALDTVLMEKGLFCKNHMIQWSCMVDGTKLDFMKLEDIYAIFGNALDNAVEAVLELINIEKRVISVKILEQNQLLMIQIQNYYNESLRFENGLPVTTKKDKQEHGYGMKSIRHTVEKYNGVVTIQARNQVFMLQILIPISEK